MEVFFLFVDTRFRQMSMQNVFVFEIIFFQEFFFQLQAENVAAGHYLQSINFMILSRSRHVWRISDDAAHYKCKTFCSVFFILSKVCLIICFFLCDFFPCMQVDRKIDQKYLLSHKIIYYCLISTRA